MAICIHPFACSQPTPAASLQECVHTIPKLYLNCIVQYHEYHSRHNSIISITHTFVPNSINVIEGGDLAQMGWDCHEIMGIWELYFSKIVDVSKLEKGENRK